MSNLLARYYGSAGDMVFSPDADDSDGIDWHPADPILGEYVGGVGGLKRQGFAHDPDSGWRWHNAMFDSP